MRASSSSSLVAVRGPGRAYGAVCERAAYIEERARPTVRQTSASGRGVPRGLMRSAATSSPVAGAPFFEELLEDLHLHRQLADLGSGVLQRGSIRCSRLSARLERGAAGSEELLAPAGDAVGLDAQLTRERVDVLAVEDAQHDLGLASRGEPGLCPTFGRFRRNRLAGSAPDETRNTARRSIRGHGRAEGRGRGAGTQACVATEQLISSGVGIAIYPRDGAGGPHLPRSADSVMYSAKRFPRGIASCSHSKYAGGVGA